MNTYEEATWLDSACVGRGWTSDPCVRAVASEELPRKTACLDNIIKTTHGLEDFLAFLLSEGCLEWYFETPGYQL